MTSTMEALLELENLARVDDPNFFADDPYPVLARLRREAPALRCSRLNTRLITRYSDVRELSKTPQVWSVRKGIQLKDAHHGDALEDRFFPEGAELISVVDPPRHGDLRKVIAPSFLPRTVASLEPHIRAFAVQLLDTVEPGTEIDFVPQLADLLPMWTIAHFMGLPISDTPLLRFWTDEMMKVGSTASAEELEAAAANMGDLNTYFLDRLDHKRADLGTDFLSSLLTSTDGNEKLSDLNVLMLSLTVMVAGNGTTRNLLSGLIDELARHPEQRELLGRDPSLAPGAVDETLRYFSPVPAFLRTALVDTEVAGETIEAGEHAFLLYVSANHDETVFPEPERFDITRTNNPSHLAFGFGNHVCPGASFARLECKVFLEELIKRFPRWDITGERLRRPTVMENSWSVLPVTFHAR